MPEPQLMPTPAMPPKPRLTGWRKAAFVIGMIAASLRLILFLFMHFPSHLATNAPHSANAPQATWPVKPGDVLTFKPGDANIAKWAADPKADDLIVSKVIPGGDPAVPNTTLCVFAPDIVAGPSQPSSSNAGGTLAVDGQDLIVGWRVHWHGGDTVPADLKKPDYDPNCGQDVELLLTSTQIHDLINILAGLPQPPPEPGVPAGTTITLPQK